MDATMERDAPLNGEGTALSFPQLKARIKRETDFILGKEDQILAVAIMLQIGVEEYERLFLKHEEAVGHVMERNVNALISQMGELTADFSNEALNESLREKIAQLAEHKSINEAMVTTLRSNLRSLKTYTTINLILFVAIAAFAIFIMF